MDLSRYASSPFGAARRTGARHGYVAYFPRPIPRTIDLPARTVRLLGDAESSLGRLDGVGRLLPNSDLLIRPYLIREAIASTRIEGTRASIAEVYDVDAGAGSQPRSEAPAVQIRSTLEGRGVLEEGEPGARGQRRYVARELMAAVSDEALTAPPRMTALA